MNIGRRRFITQFAATAAGRCLLGPAAASLAAGNAWAQQEAKPKFVSFITPLGHGRNWVPDTPSSGELSSFPADSKPLEKHASDLLIINRNTSVVRALRRSGGVHTGGYAAATNGNIEWKGTVLATGVGSSIDQYLVENWGGGAQSLQLGVLPAGNYGSIISWKNSQPLAPAGNARQVYNNLFGSLGGEIAEQEAIQLRQQSILDQWTREISRLNANLGSVHRQVLDQHLTRIEEVEKRLNESGAFACSNSLNITNNDEFYTKSANFPVIGKQMMDMIVLALSCGQYQAASLAWNNVQSKIKHTWILGSSTLQHHGITHRGNEEQCWSEVSKIDNWYAEQFSYLIDNLSLTMDSQGGRLIDSTILYWTSETGLARSHQPVDIVATLAGNYKGNFQTGKLFDHNNGPLNDVFSAIATGLDVPTDKFGRQSFATGRYNAILT